MEKKFSHLCFVVENDFNLTQDMLLGDDFLTKYNAVIDYQQNTLTLNNIKFKLNNIKNEIDVTRSGNKTKKIDRIGVNNSENESDSNDSDDSSQDDDKNNGDSQESTLHTDDNK